MLSKPFTKALEGLSYADWYLVCDCLHIARKHIDECVEDIEHISPRANFAEVLRTRAERAEDIREIIGAALHVT